MAEKRLVEHQYSFEWDKHGRLIYWQVLPAFKEHHTTKEKFWFSQATISHVSYMKASSAFVDEGLPDDLYAFSSYYGDGSEIEPEVLQHIRAVSWQCAVGFRWRSGDLLALDNMVVQHSRLSYKEPRKVLLCLTSNWSSPLIRRKITSSDVCVPRHQTVIRCMFCEASSFSISNLSEWHLKI